MSVLDRTHVSRAAAVVPTVAQSPQTIFTVSGGRVLVQAPTVGTPVDLSAALTMTSFAAGVHVTLGATVGAALSHDSTARAGLLLPLPQQLLLPSGSITLTGSATQTGTMKWDLLYRQIDGNAVVVAA
jgi:hypothetical protein